MNEFNPGDRIVISDFGYKPEADLFNGATGTVIGHGSFYHEVLLDTPIRGFGTAGNPMLLLASEMEKVGDNG